MSKLVEGQLSQLQMASYFSRVSHSFASSTLRSQVSMISTQQANYPDVLPRNTQIRPLVEADTGRVVSSFV